MRAGTREQRNRIDNEIIRRVKNGDRQAFDALVLEYQSRIRGLVSRYTKGSSEAVDLTQEAFYKAYRGLTAFRGECAFYTWLYQIALNTAKNYLMQHNRTAGLSEDPNHESPNGWTEPEPADHGTPEHYLLAEEIQRTVDDAMNDLPMDLRTAIALREREGLSYQDIALTMDCPVGTVRSRIFRARQLIDERIRPLLA